MASRQTIVAYARFSELEGGATAYTINSEIIIERENMRRISPAAGAALLAVLFLLPQAARAQDPGQQEILVNYSLYYENFKNKNYADALPNLKWMLENAPAYRDDKNFERAVTVYEQMALAEADAGVQRALFDTALVMFDTAVPTVQEAGGEIDEFEWTLDKGKFIFEHLEHLPDLEGEVATNYRRAWDMDPDKLDSYYLEYILAHLIQNEGDKEGTVAFLDEIEEVRGEEEAITEMVSKWRGVIFTNPEERYAYVQSELEKDPENSELLDELCELAGDLEYRDDMYEYCNRLMEISPTAKLYRTLGTMMLSDGDTDGAIENFTKALEMASDDDVKRDIYYNMALAEQEMGRLSRARTSFRKALEIDASFGRALLGIGDLYVTAISNCGSFEREDRAVYWLATDYFARAKSADPNVASSADARIRQYREYYPDAEAMFFMKWTAGDRYSVNKGCYSWINENTTVKSP